MENEKRTDEVKNDEVKGGEAKSGSKRPPERRYAEPGPEPEGTQPKLRTWGFAVGAVVLLAVLTLVLCAMAGVFDFGGGGETETEPPVVQTEAPEAGTPVPDTTEPPVTETPEPEETEGPQTHTINVIAGNGGSISPSGIVQVEDGGSITFTMTPDEGWELSELIIDGMSVVISDSYTLSNVRGEHTVYAIFREIPQPTETPEPMETPYDPWFPYWPEETPYEPAYPTDDADFDPWLWLEGYGPGGGF